LGKDGINPDKLTDKEVVDQVSRWLFQRSQYRYMFCTFYVGFTDGKPQILSGLEHAFEREKGDPQWTVQQQFENELLGKSMFNNKTYGTCTSTAVLQANHVNGPPRLSDDIGAAIERPMDCKFWASRLVMQRERPVSAQEPVPEFFK